jgi:Flp pilus assembly pilin Flp
MRRLLQRVCGNDRGATAIEYAMIVAMIALAASVAIQAFADGTIDMWDFVRSNALSNL